MERGQVQGDVPSLSKLFRVRHLSIDVKNPLFKLWLIIGIGSGFAAVLFFSLTYLNEKILCNLECRVEE
jgi:hypothetical protein